jgi:outer membrane protein insertion porin family
MPSSSRCTCLSNRRRGAVRPLLATLAFLVAFCLAGAASGRPYDASAAKRWEARNRARGPLVTGVRFVGNETFGRKELLPYMKMRESGLFHVTNFTLRDLSADLDNIQRFYMTQGFLDAAAVAEDMKLSPDSLGIEILIGVYEGARWTVSDVSFEGNHAVTQEALAAAVTLKKGSPLLSDAIELDRRSVLEAYARRAYLDARVFQDLERDEDAKTESIRYRIVEGEPAVIAAIDITGAKKTRKHVIEREFEFKPGELFDFGKIGRTQASIYRTGLFHSVWIEPAPADTGKAAKRLVVRVSERPSGAVDLAVGYAAIDGPEVNAGITNRNLRGQASELGIEGQYSERSRDVQASIGDPWFAGRRIAVKGTGRYQRRDEASFVAETAGGSVIATKHLGAAVTLDGGYEYDRTVVLEASEGEGEVGTNYTSDLTAALTLDTRDDILNARRGLLARIGLEVASSRLGGTNDFVRYGFEWRTFRKVGRGRVVALGGRFGWVRPQGEGNEVPVNERYFAGGEGSVRGFERDSLGPLGEDGEPKGGRALALFRAELRLPLWKKLGLAGFVDAGQVFDDLGATKLSLLAVGAGGGLRYETRVGVFRFDVAAPASEGGRAQYYFSMGQAF